MTTAASTPSLAGNMSGGCTPVVLGNNNDNGCFHPLPRSKCEWRGSSLLGGYRHPPPSFYLWGETLHVTLTTRSGIGRHCHPLPCSKRERRVSCFVLGDYGHGCPLPHRVIPMTHPSHRHEQLLVRWIKGATGTQEQCAPLSCINRESSLFPCPLTLSARGRVIPHDLRCSPCEPGGEPLLASVQQGLLVG
jgi:hypothetical protein